jgi:hypothetical protein
MDFSQLITEYKGLTQSKPKGSFWWKEQKWNKKERVVDPETIEKQFSRRDYIVSMSGSWQRCYSWLSKNKVIRTEPPMCPTCK